MIWIFLAAALVVISFGAWFAIGRARTTKPEGALSVDAAVGALAAASPTSAWSSALSRTRALFAGLFPASMDEAALSALEEALVRADVGARTSAALVAEIRGAADPKAALVARVRARLGGVSATLLSGGPPHVILVVGVNGSGKTTTIGKLAARYRHEGKSVLLGAGDTFRAGAIEQLKVWGERAAVDVIAQQEGADPAAVAHQAVEAARARGVDVVICDTAGRLQAQKALMDELAKVRRVVGKLVPGAPHEVLLVLDATMGQNALSQARIFKDVAGVTGVVLTKLDGTAKGGVVVAIAEEFGLPVKLVGLGEKIEDLQPFDADAFAAALVGD